MPEKSKRILLYDAEKAKQINPETLKMFQKYQIDMSIRDLSPKTIAGYNNDLMQWFIYMYDNQFNLSVLEATDDDVEEYVYFRKTSGNNNARLRRVMSSISAFYRFLRKKKLINEAPTEFLDRPKGGQRITVQTYLTKEDVRLMREKLLEYGNIQLLTYAFLSLTTMGRVNAISHLRWDQIDWDERIFSNVLEKEGKIVELSFNQEVKGYLEKLVEYRKEHNINDYGWVFRSPYTTENQPVTNGTLNDWCKTIGKMIGHPTLHPHDFRHSMAQIMKLENVALEYIAECLHHESTETTQRWYLQKDTRKARKIKDSVEI